ncbi:MAG: hypothetical protein WCG15_10190 [Actinomycetes bacterium]|jgi:hypothetical protein
MAVTYKVLGQNNPAINTLTTLYTVPANTSTVVSTLSVCNQSGSAGTFRVAVRPAGATIDPKHYVAYDTQVPGNDTIHLTIGMSLGQTDVVSILSSSGFVSFNLFGSEIS